MRYHYHICVTVTTALQNLFGGKIPLVTGKKLNLCGEMADGAVVYLPVKLAERDHKGATGP